jgi:DNA-binding NarL/FixJ family response regulator
MIQHLERAASMAAEQGRPAGRAEALAWLAVGATRLGVERHDAELIDAAERAADEARQLAGTLPGLPPWGAFAVTARVAILASRGDLEAARQAIWALLEELGEFQTRVLFIEPTALAVSAMASSTDERDQGLVRQIAAQVVGFVAERTEDAEVLGRWLAVPEAKALTEIAGGLDAARELVRGLPDSLLLQRLPVLPLDLTPEESALMRLMMEGRSDAEIGRELSLDEAEVARRLGAVFAKIGAPSRSVATLYAFMADLV